MRTSDGVGLHDATPHDQHLRELAGDAGGNCTGNEMDLTALTRALDAGQVDVAVHWLQLLLLAGGPANGGSSHEGPPEHRTMANSARSRRLQTLQRAVAAMLPVVVVRHVEGRGNAADVGKPSSLSLSLRPGLASKADDASCELSYAQLQMFALQRLRPTSTAYNVVRALRFPTVAVDLASLQSSCDAVMAKHEALRTCFDADASANGQPRQCVHPLTHFRGQSILQVVSSELLSPQREEASATTQLAEFVAKMAAEPFDLARQAPMRVYAIVPSDQKTSSPWVLVAVLHHIVTDAASSQLFWRDFLAFYTRFSRSDETKATASHHVKQLEGETSSRDRVTYRDFACWQRARLRSGLLAPSLQYWIQQLTIGGVPPLLELPFDTQKPHAPNDGAVNMPSAPEPAEVDGDVVVFQSTVALQQAFSALCRAQGASVFMGLLAVFHLLIARLSGQRGFVIGAPASGRAHAELQDVMGYFVNTLPLRLDSQDAGGADGSFEDFLAAVREVVLDAYKHMEVPFHKVLEHLRASAQTRGREGDGERRWQHPLFQVMFSWEQSGEDEAAPSGSCGVGYEELPLPRRSAKFDLMLSMRYRRLGSGSPDDSGGRVLEGSMEYPTARFARSTAKRFACYYLELLEQVTRAPSAMLRSPAVSMLSEKERRQLVCDWGSPKSASPPSVGLEKSRSDFIGDRLLRQVRNCPLRPALHFEGTQWSYQDLWDHSGRVVGALQRLQAGGNDAALRVGLLLDRGLESVAAMVGALRVHAAFVPLDTEFPRERLRYMACDSALHVILTQRKHVTTATELVEPTKDLSDSGKAAMARVLVLLYEDLDISIADEKTPSNSNAVIEPSTLNAPQDQGRRTRDPDNTAAYILYTSGSTGHPKGVVVSHAALLTTLCWTVRTYRVTSRDVFLQSTSTTLDGSLSQLFSPLLVGASARITRPRGLHDLRYMRDVVVDTPRITFCVFVPSYFSLLVDFMSDLGDAFPRSVRHVVLAGEAFPMELARQFYIKQQDATTCLVNEYGPTEASITSTSFHLPRELALQETSATSSSIAGLQSVPIGKPIDDHPVIVLDANRRLVPVNVPGELYIGGAGVALGYWQRLDLTRKTFISHEDLQEVAPLLGPRRGYGWKWYKTGDLVKWLPTGDLLFLGRTDAQVKHHGMRIELQEVRNVLLRHPRIKAAEVLLLSQPKLQGQKDRQASSTLTGFIMLTDNDSNDLSEAHLNDEEFVHELRAYLREHLPFHMVPQALRVMARWPRTPNGKVDLRSLAASTNGSNSADPLRIESSASGTSSSGDAATMTVQLAMDILRQVWVRALGLEILADAEGEAAENDEERLMSRSFFELGGDSLAAIRAMALAQARGLPLALDQFFRCASLPDMARSVASSSLDLREWTSQTLVPLNWAKTTPSAPVQALFLFHDADGTVWKLLELARRLPFPVIGVQATVATSNGTCNGLVSTEVRPLSVEQLAESYWTAIRERQRKGPYALGGFSFGCRVAHEVARLAVREGHTLLPVTLLDGLPFELPTTQQNSPDNTKRKETARRQVEQYAMEAFDGGDSLLRQLGVNYRTHCAMEEAYQPYSITEATVSSPEPRIWLQAELYKTRRWHEDVSRFRLLGVDVATVAAVPNCTHLTMLRHPSVELVARKIRESFARHEMQNAPKCMIIDN